MHVGHPGRVEAHQTVVLTMRTMMRIMTNDNILLCFIQFSLKGPRCFGTDYLRPPTPFPLPVPLKHASEIPAIFIYLEKTTMS